ncbi:MAG: hypothetical protein JWQ28_262 [Pedobacter sp.]|jgi:hypothetical protein|nr:hypothetical protein [Pedobacter sp.]
MKKLQNYANLWNIFDTSTNFKKMIKINGVNLWFHIGC